MSEIEDLISLDKPVLVDFWADWCLPCRTMNPILSDTITELDGSVVLIKVDADTSRDLMIKYGIRSIPTLILFKSGKQLWRHSGVLSKGELVSIINSKIQESV